MIGLVAALAACEEEKAAPPPQELSADDISHYDQMLVIDHAGPKAQILMERREEPVWFSSVRDAFAFHLLPEEPRDVAAIYVTDMGRARSWDDPGPGVWIEAREALYVIGSDVRGGMGAEEPVPFGERAAAEAFAAKHGGEIVAFEGVPDDYILGATAEPAHGNGSHGSHGAVEDQGKPAARQ
jgi:copper chaperone NosL